MLFLAPNPLLGLLIKPELCNMLLFECKKMKKYTKKGHFLKKLKKSIKIKEVRFKSNKSDFLFF